MLKMNWHYFVLFFFFFTISANDFEQNWVLKNPLPANTDLKGLCQVGHETGFACGSFQTSLKTTDGGLTWQTPGTIGSVVPGYIKFTTAQHGPACLGDYFVAVTYDGALTWDTLVN